MCVGVVLDEVRHQPVDFGGRTPARFGRQPALDHQPRAAAHHVARRVVRHRRKPLAGEDDVEGRHQVGGGVDQRSVQIEYDNGGRHDPGSLAGGGRDGKGALPTSASGG